MGETSAQVLARLLNNGGKILVVGGEISNLPREYQEHPQLLLWDDDKQGFQNKEIPSNVRAVLYTRWISHSTAHKINDAVKKLNIIKYPMLKTREIKSLLSEVVKMDSSNKEETTEPKITLNSFLAKNLDLGIDYSNRGSIKKEADRLFNKAKAEGFNTTLASVSNSTSVIVRSLKKNTSPSPSPSVKTSEDDFSELDTLISDAITAMKLVQEHLPKVKKETERLRGMRTKVLEFFKE